jgi:hypothetical protein
MSHATTSQISTLVHDIVSYISDTKADNKNIQAQINALLGNQLVTPVIDLNNGVSLDAIIERKEFQEVCADVIAVGNGIIDKAPSDSVRNSAMSDYVKRINRGYAAEATKKAHTLAQVTPSGDVLYPVMARKIVNKVMTISFEAKRMEFAQQIGKDGKVKPEAKIVRDADKAEGKAGERSEAVAAIREPQTMLELVGAVVQACSRLGIDPVDFEIALAGALHPVTSTGKGKKGIKKDLPASLKTQAA